MIQIVIKGNPIPKQSARFRVFKKGGKYIGSAYQDSKTKSNAEYYRYCAKEQLSKEFELLDGYLFARVVYIHKAKKSLKKSEKLILDNNGLLFKKTKPDLHDNLNKLPFDSLNNIVY